jgi:hypothetical protein
VGGRKGWRKRRRRVCVAYDSLVVDHRGGGRRREGVREGGRRVVCTYCLNYIIFGEGGREGGVNREGFLVDR